MTTKQHKVTKNNLESKSRQQMPNAYHIEFQAAIKKIIEEGITLKKFQPGNPGQMMWVRRGVVQLAMEEQVKDDRKRIDRQGLQRILDLILKRFAQTPCRNSQKANWVY